MEPDSSRAMAASWHVDGQIRTSAAQIRIPNSAADEADPRHGIVQAFSRSAEAIPAICRFDNSPLWGKRGQYAKPGRRDRNRRWGENDMNEVDFETKLRADGYTEIETQNLEPRPPKGEHGHPFAVRGLVRSSPFILPQDVQRT